MASPIQPINALVEGEVLALNNAHAAELSWLTAERLPVLVSRAWMAACIGQVEAFIIAFDQDADYDSPNFLWFRERYPRFVYVDRVAVSPAARGRGHARRLYEHVLTTARGQGHGRVVCEINADPPNPGSEAFHLAMGFHEVGRAVLPGGAKTVSYHALAVS